MQDAVAILAPWQLKHYAALLAPLTVSLATRRYEEHRRNLETLRGMEEPEALRAATSLSTPAALQIAGAAATSPHALSKKADMLASLMPSMEPTWLVHPMVAAALRADARRLDLTRAQEAALMARLPSAFDQQRKPA